MKNWRPPNWKTPDGQWDFVDWSNAQIFEAGADEMLEALRGMGDKTEIMNIRSGNPWGKHMELSKDVIGGITVFIPDEK